MKDESSVTVRLSVVRVAGYRGDTVQSDGDVREPVF